MAHTTLPIELVNYVWIPVQVPHTQRRIKTASFLLITCHQSLSLFTVLCCYHCNSFETLLSLLIHARRKTLLLVKNAIYQLPQNYRNISGHNYIFREVGEQKTSLDQMADNVLCCWKLSAPESPTLKAEPARRDEAITQPQLLAGSCSCVQGTTSKKRTVDGFSIPADF